jgi:hypothetical protein
MQTVDNTDLVNTAQARELLGKASPSTIARWVASGKLVPAHKLPGLRGAYLFHRTDVEALAKGRAA